MSTNCVLLATAGLDIDLRFNEELHSSLREGPIATVGRAVLSTYNIYRITYYRERAQVFLILTFHLLQMTNAYEGDTDIDSSSNPKRFRVPY